MDLQPCHDACLATGRRERRQVMGGLIGDDSPCAKGPIPYCLDQCSKGDGARERLVQLRNAIQGLGPTYRGLETVFDTHLVSRIYADPLVRQNLAEHLRKNWFNDDAPDAYFPQQKVAEKYAKGVIKAIELSLNGQPDPVPINAWWIIQSADGDVRFLKLAEVNDDSVTVSDNVTLLILTPKPQSEGQNATKILGQAQAWVTEHSGQDQTVAARQVENRPPK